MVQPEILHTSVINHPVKVYALRGFYPLRRYDSALITLYQSKMTFECYSSDDTLTVNVPYSAIRGMFLSVSLTGKFPHQAEFHCYHKNQWYCFVIMEEPGDQENFLKLREFLVQLIPDPKFSHFYKRPFTAFDLHTVEVAKQTKEVEFTNSTEMT